MTPAPFFALIWAGYHPAHVTLAPQPGCTVKDDGFGWYCIPQSPDRGHAIHPRLDDDGFGDCPAFHHSHASQPGDCFDDKWDRLVLSP